MAGKGRKVVRSEETVSIFRIEVSWGPVWTKPCEGLWSNVQFVGPVTYKMCLTIARRTATDDANLKDTIFELVHIAPICFKNYLSRQLKAQLQEEPYPSVSIDEDGIRVEDLEEEDWATIQYLEINGTVRLDGLRDLSPRKLRFYPVPDEE